MTVVIEPQTGAAQANAKRLSATVVMAEICSLAVGSGPARDPNLPHTATASGQVMYNGKPIDHGAVTLHPVCEGNPAVGALD